jgi:predicted nucleic acid-binding protein
MTDVEPKYFVDTNTLIRATVISAPEHAITKRMIEHLVSTKAELWISRQILREYASVITREQTYAKPVKSVDIAVVLRTFVKRFRVADENDSVTTLFIDLLETIEVGGKQVHDANIVATMQSYNISSLLTYNLKDFERFAAYIEPVDPIELARTIFQT